MAMVKQSFLFKTFLALGMLQVSFLLGSCDRTEVILESKTYYQIESATSEYLHDSNFIKDLVGADAIPNQTFCAYQVYGMEAKTRKLEQYLWVFCQEYKFINNQLTTIAAGSFPVALSLKKDNAYYHIISHQIPREGKERTADLKAIFPDYVLENVNFPLNNSAYDDYLVSKLEGETRQAAKSYFKISEEN